MKENRVIKQHSSNYEPNYRDSFARITRQLNKLSLKVQSGMAHIRVGQEYAQKAKGFNAGLYELEKIYYVVRGSKRLQVGNLLGNAKLLLSLQSRPVLSIDRLKHIFMLHRDYLLSPAERNAEQDFYFFLTLMQQARRYFADVLDSHRWKIGNTIVSAFSRFEKDHVELALKKKIDLIFGSCVANAPPKETMVSQKEFKAPQKVRMKWPRVSVIIPVYNKAGFLGSCLESLLSSGYEKLEIVCIDDKSTDESMQILQKIASSDSRVKVYSNEINSGASVSRNLGIQRSTGEYLFFLDADDIVAENAIEFMVEVAEAQNSDIVRGKITGVKNDGTLCTLAAEHLLHTESIDAVTWFNEESLWYYWYFTANMYRASFIKDNCIIFPANLRNEDPFFLCRCFLNAGNVSLYSDVVYYYRIGEEQKSKTPTLDFLIGWSMGNFYIYQLIQNHHKQAQYFMIHFSSLMTHSINAVKHLEEEQAKSVLVYIKLIFKNADLGYFKNPDTQPWSRKKFFPSEYIDYVSMLKNDDVSLIYNTIARDINV